MREEIAGEVALWLDHAAGGAWRLPRHQSVRAGRSSTAGIRIRPGWVPSGLARFEPVHGGWHLVNGGRTRARVSNPQVVDAWFAPYAVVMLQRGDWSIRWDSLDRACHMSVRVGDVRRTGVLLPHAIDAGPETEIGAGSTDFAAVRLTMNPQLRHRLAVLFGHLILDERAPANLCATAAEQLNVSEQAIKNAANRYKDRVNQSRGTSIVTLEDLGYYLVHVTGVLRPEHLEP